MCVSDVSWDTTPSNLVSYKRDPPSNKMMMLDTSGGVCESGLCLVEETREQHDSLISSPVVTEVQRRLFRPTSIVQKALTTDTRLFTVKLKFSRLFTISNESRVEKQKRYEIKFSSGLCAKSLALDGPPVSPGVGWGQTYCFVNLYGVWSSLGTVRSGEESW